MPRRPARRSGCRRRRRPAHREFPDFVYPAAPAGLGEPAARAAPDAGWRYLQAGDYASAEREFAAIVKAAPGVLPGGSRPGLCGAGPQGCAGGAARISIARWPTTPPTRRRWPARATPLLGRTDRGCAGGFRGGAGGGSVADRLRSRVDVLRFRARSRTIAAARKAAEAGRLDEARGLRPRSRRRPTARSCIASSPGSSGRPATTPRRWSTPQQAVDARSGRRARADPDRARCYEAQPRLDQGRRRVRRGERHRAVATRRRPRSTQMRETRGVRGDARGVPRDRDRRRRSRARNSRRCSASGSRICCAARDAATPVVITDIRGNWAAPWILAVTRAGVMDAFPNHTFQPRRVVRRADLAQAVSRVLDADRQRRTRRRGEWRDAAPDISGRAALASELSGGRRAPCRPASCAARRRRFQLSRPVTGAEAIERCRSSRRSPEARSR